MDKLVTGLVLVKLLEVLGLLLRIFLVEYVLEVIRRKNISSNWITGEIDGRGLLIPK